MKKGNMNMTPRGNTQQHIKYNRVNDFGKMKRASI